MGKLILVRHGNTFEKGEKAYFVGLNEDLELTSEGFSQASSVADFISQFEVDVLLSGKLKRQVSTAAVISEKIGVATTISEALNEFDYGQLGGKTLEEFSDEDQEAHKLFVQDGVWPAYFEEDENQRKDELLSLMSKLQETNAVLVTSGGVLMTIYKLLFPDFYSSDAKVKTGAYCEISFTGETWSLQSWNTKP